MRIFDMIDLCIRNLTRRKIRTLLTVIGVVVGTCSIVVMVSIGIGMNESQKAMLENMGDLKMINVYNYNYGGDSSSQNKITDDIVKEWQQLEGVDIATPMYENYDLNFVIYSGNGNRYSMEFTPIGVYPEALEKFGYELKSGEYLTESENKRKINVVFGEYTAYNFQDTKRPFDKGYIDIYQYIYDENGIAENPQLPDPFVNTSEDSMIIGTINYDENGNSVLKVKYGLEVQGILKADFNKDYRTSNSVFMPINELIELIKEGRKANGNKSKLDVTYNEVYVRVTDIKYIDSVEEYIKNQGFETSSMESIRKPMEEQARQQQLVLGGLGAISLFVAAIGITNTMIMSIYERTREIGVMKALGCYVRNIRAIFLMEAGCIGLIGGIAGVILSYILSYLLNRFGNGSLNLGSSIIYDTADTTSKMSIIPPWLVILAIVFATMIGLISGYYPANRAVKISAIEAIKSE